MAFADNLRKIIWNDDGRFTLNDTKFHFVTSHHETEKTRDGTFIILKGQSMLDRYAGVLGYLEAKNILELGVWEGGSAILLSMLFEPRKFVGVDIRWPLPDFDAMLTNHPLRDTISIHYKTSQDDEPKLREMIRTELNDTLDLVIDDASHHYNLSVRSFEIVFPYIRPGGFYVLEDWGWAHWPGHWQDKSGTREHPVTLSNLVFQFSMICASRQDLVSRVIVTPSACFVERGPGQIAKSGLKLDSLYMTQGRIFTKL